MPGKDKFDNKKYGTVYLLGAGPGNADLLTVRGARLIQQAEVVVYDRLVGAEILALIPARARRVDVGKQAGRHPIPQEEINAILLREAQQHSTVVRLKGGDPFVFGRGGEEAEFLATGGIPFEIVPGITSAIAAPAYAGIPVTHRDHSSSLHIITGHGKNGRPVVMDYGALARLGGTLVFLMSISTAPSIVSGLLAAGLAEETPAAVVENGTTAHQRSFISTLKQLPEIIAQEQVHSPALIVVGGVCAAAERLDWRSKLPLYGCRVLITRPREVAADFGMALREMGADISYYPCIQLEPLRFAIELVGIDWLALTSAAGVEAFFAQLQQSGQDSRALAGLKIAVVGEKTALALQNYGLRADFMPTVFDGRHLAQELLAGVLIAAGQRLALYRAQQGGEDIVEILQNAGVCVADVPVYRTVAAQALPAPAWDYDYITFTSASCVENFMVANAGRDFRTIKALCIGPQTALAAEQAGMHVFTSPQATTAAMIETLQEVWHEHQAQTFTDKR